MKTRIFTVILSLGVLAMPSVSRAEKEPAFTKTAPNQQENKQKENKQMTKVELEELGKQLRADIENGYKELSHRQETRLLSGDSVIDINDIVLKYIFVGVNVGLNIRTSTFDQFVKSKELQRYLNEVIYKIPDDCIGCDWLKVCGGGSKASHRYSDENKYNNPSVYCESLQDYFAEVVKSVVEHGASPDSVKRALLS